MDPTQLPTQPIVPNPVTPPQPVVGAMPVTPPAVAQPMPQAAPSPYPPVSSSNTPAWTDSSPSGGGIPFGLIGLIGGIISIGLLVFLIFTGMNVYVKSAIGSVVAALSLAAGIMSLRKKDYPNIIGLIGVIVSTVMLMLSVGYGGVSGYLNYKYDQSTKQENQQDEQLDNSTDPSTLN